jgi:hypothetical protein
MNTSEYLHKKALNQKAKYLIFKLGTSKEFLIKKAASFVESDEEGSAGQLDQYSITFNYVEPHECHQVCADCKFCIHYYKCDCIAYKQKSQFCRHLHMISSYLGGQNLLTSNVTNVTTSSIDQKQLSANDPNPTLNALSSSDAISQNSSHFAVESSFAFVAEQQFEKIRNMALCADIDWATASASHPKQVKELAQLFQRTCDLVDSLPKKSPQHLNKN